MIKICLISEAKSIHTQRWAASLAQAGCEIHLVSSSKVHIPNVKLYHQRIYSSNPIQQIISNKRTRLLFKKINPDIFHVFGLFSIYSFGTMVLAKNLKNLMMSVWGSDVVPASNKDSCREKFIKKYLLNKADHLVASSEYLRRETQKYLNKSKKIEIVPWGIDLKKFYPLLKQNSKNIVKVGFAKKIYELSGPDIALKAFKYASERSRKKLVLRIAGDGPMASNLKKEAKKMGIADHIEWLGWLKTTKSLRKFYQSIDIFLMPSRRESFGVAAAEASASGLPVIASNFGGIPEIILDKKSGFLVNSENISGFGEALILLAENEEMRTKMGLEGRKIIKNNYKWNLCVDKLIEIYKKAKMK